ncbi:hypothetical protein J3R83DRAFT_7190 [Lanmaoa asiatica]|nr:hypothetical protein J3R83DRAFT_7190 [Lanmaoa asiatica]
MAISSSNPLLLTQSEANPSTDPLYLPFLSPSSSAPDNGSQTIQADPAQLFLPFPDLPPLPAITRSISVDEQFNVAALMIQTSGRWTDVLAQHQQQRRASNVPSQE